MILKRAKKWILENIFELKDSSLDSSLYDMT